MKTSGGSGVWAKVLHSFAQNLNQWGSRVPLGRAYGAPVTVIVCGLPAVTPADDALTTVLPFATAVTRPCATVATPGWLDDH